MFFFVGEFVDGRERGGGEGRRKGYRFFVIDASISFYSFVCV